MLSVHLSGCAYLSLYPWAAYQTYEWSPGYKTTALWNVNFAWGRTKSLAWWRREGEEETLERLGHPPRDDNVTYKFDDITYPRP